MKHANFMHIDSLGNINNRIKFNSETKLLPVYNMASSGPKKMLFLIILYTDTHLCVYKIIKNNIFLGPEKAML